MIFTMLFATQSVVFTMIFVTVWVFRNDIRYVIRRTPIFALLWVPENDIRYVICFAPIFALLFASEQIYIHLNIFQESAQYRRLELGRL